jgi:hypothetical protein
MRLHCVLSGLWNRVKVQAVVPLLAMAEARVQTQTSTRGIYDGQSVTGTRFPLS